MGWMCTTWIFSLTDRGHGLIQEVLSDEGSVRQCRGKQTRSKGEPKLIMVFQDWESLTTPTPEECEGNCKRKEECQLRRQGSFTYVLVHMKKQVLKMQAFILSPDCILQQQNTLTSRFWFSPPQSLFPCKPIFKTRLLQRKRTMNNTQELLEPMKAEYVNSETPVFCGNTHAVAL